MNLGITNTMTVGLLLVGLCAGGLACSERSLSAVAGGTDAGQGAGGTGLAGVGGATVAGVGGAPLAGVGGATGLGGAGGTAGPFDPGGYVIPSLANNKLDVLFMIDDSQSMAPLQAKLLADFSVFMNILKGLPTGLPDIHLAVISSDTGPGEYDLPALHCPYLGDQGRFQYQSRGDCTESPITTGQTFLQASSNQEQTNYLGDISDAFVCIAALGEGGCGFEGQLKSVRWALDSNPNDADPAPGGTPAANQGFLRADAYLAVILLTNEDDCSVPTDSDLIDPTQTHMREPYGPLGSFRCNEFGHLCDINGTVQHPVRGLNNDLTGCISNDTPAGKETKVADEVAFLKSLKADPRQIFVFALTGPATPYNVDEINQTLSDGTMELQPSTVHSCMENSGEYADPAIRIQQWVQSFAGNGLLLPICVDSFAPALTQIANALGQPLGPVCVPESAYAGCTVFDRASSVGTVGEGYANVPLCSDNQTNQPCYTLSSDPTTCPGGLLYTIDRFGTAPPAGGTTVSCTYRPG